MALEQVGGIKSKTGISRLTTEYLYWHIDSEENFASSTARIAFVSNTRNSKPNENEWHSADVVETPGAEDGSSVRALIGPGGIDLSPQDDMPVVYKVWISLEDEPQTFVRLAGSLAVR